MGSECFIDNDGPVGVVAPVTRWRVLAVVALAVLAGCSVFSGNGGGGGDTPTVTPAAVPGEAVPINEGPAGVRLESERIVANHRAVLANDSHVVEEILRVGPADNASFRQRVRITRASGGTPFYVDGDVAVSHEDYVGRGTDVWWDGEEAHYRYSFSIGQYTYSVDDERPDDRLHVDGRFEPVLDALHANEVRQRRDGVLYVAGVLNDSDAVPRPRRAIAIENATMSLRIRPSGVVDRLAIGYNATYHDLGRHRVRYSYRVTSVGTATVAPPEWVATENESAD